MQNSDTTRPTATNRWDLFLARYHLSSPPFLVTSLHLTFPLPKLCGVGQCLSFTLLLHVFSVKLYFATSQPVSTGQSFLQKSHLHQQPFEGLRVSSASPHPSLVCPLQESSLKKGGQHYRGTKGSTWPQGKIIIIIIFFFFAAAAAEA